MNIGIEESLKSSKSTPRENDKIEVQSFTYLLRYKEILERNNPIDV